MKLDKGTSTRLRKKSAELEKKLQTLTVVLFLEFSDNFVSEKSFWYAHLGHDRLDESRASALRVTVIDWPNPAGSGVGVLGVEPDLTGPHTEFVLNPDSPIDDTPSHYNSTVRSQVKPVPSGLSGAIVQTTEPVQSDLAYAVLFYPDPSPSGRTSLVTDLQHMLCIHTCTVGVFD